ncbi:MAG: hypothetical protein FWG46_04720 [Treponema sp.]|nr:hypothetical protein [Treponema sp.]
MKKVVIVALIITLAAGAVFAELKTSAWAAGRAYIAAFDNNDVFPDSMTFGYHDLRLTADGKNEEGTFGGYLRFWARGNNNPLAGNETFGYAWWKPIDQVRLQIGQNRNIDFGVFEIVRGSSFYGAARDGGMGVLLRENAYHVPGMSATHQPHQLQNAFYGNSFDYGGATLSIYPIEGLSLNFGIPYGWDGAFKVGEHTYKNILAQVQYKITDVGRLAFGYRGNDTADFAGTGATMASDNHALFASFYLNGIENFGANLGLRLMMPFEREAGGTKNSVSYPFLAALGISFDAGDFGIKARCELSTGGEHKIGGTSMTKGDTRFFFEVLPSYNVGVCKIFLSAAVDVKSPDKGDDEVGFSINPYIAKAVGSSTFFAGLRLWSDGTKVNPPDDDARILFDIPIGLVVSF